MTFSGLKQIDPFNNASEATLEKLFFFLAREKLRTWWMSRQRAKTVLTKGLKKSGWNRRKDTNINVLTVNGAELIRGDIYVAQTMLSFCICIIFFLLDTVVYNKHQICTIFCHLLREKHVIIGSKSSAYLPVYFSLRVSFISTLM